MGILPPHDKADFGEGYGFIDEEDAFNSFCSDDPPLHKSFKISGEIYILKYVDNKLEFVKSED